MIIYTRDLDYGKMTAYAKSPERLVEYAVSLVPKWATCFPQIIDNQRFFVATQIRSMLDVPFKIRKAAVATLCDGIALSGITTGCYTVSEVLSVCDRSVLLELLRNYNE